MSGRKTGGIKYLYILFHILAWALLITLPFILQPHPDNHPDNHLVHHHRHSFELMHFIISNVLFILLFYTNAYILVPRFLNRYRGVAYTLCVLAALVVIYLIQSFFDYYVNMHPHLLGSVNQVLFIGLFIIAASISFRIISDRVREQQLRNEKENHNLRSELTFLRSQVSPHFMFNVLNNLVALARMRSSQLEPALLRLSSLMRYMLYESDEKKVSLDKEIEYLQDYIELQMLRFGDDVCLKFEISNTQNDALIEPMLLIPFIENAFKHGVGMIQDPQIDIRLRAQDNMLFFQVRNKYNETYKEEKDPNSGIGLHNVERRLNLLYADRHVLQIKQADGWYDISLELKLK